MNARTEFLDFCFELLDVAEVVRFLPFKPQQFLFDFAQFRPAAARQGNAPGMCRTQRADNVDP
ncbi:hypothetical protein D3C84_1307650 [compost metagenome]